MVKHPKNPATNFRRAQTEVVRALKILKKRVGPIDMIIKQ